MSQLEPRQQAFRNAMAHLSAAVNVITSNGPAGRCGITATAVCSVTDSPPTLMLCINRNSEMNTVFKANGRLCVNVLSGEHEEVARHFAGMTEVPMERRFALHDWREGLAGLPVLHGALANLQGRIAEVQEIGTHSVLLLELEDIQVLEQGDGLVYFSRSFHRLQCPPAGGLNGASRNPPPAFRSHRREPGQALSGGAPVGSSRCRPHGRPVPRRLRRTARPRPSPGSCRPSSGGTRRPPGGPPPDAAGS